jgi:hypothetical protein
VPVVSGGTEEDRADGSAVSPILFINSPLLRTGEVSIRFDKFCHILLFLSHFDRASSGLNQFTDVSVAGTLSKRS